MAKCRPFLVLKACSGTCFTLLAIISIIVLKGESPKNEINSLSFHCHADDVLQSTTHL